MFDRAPRLIPSSLNQAESAERTSEGATSRSAATSGWTPTHQASTCSVASLRS